MSLKSERKSKGYTLQKLADLSGVNYVKIHKIERGQIKAEHIMLRTALRLAKALECAPEDLLD